MKTKQHFDGIFKTIQKELSLKISNVASCTDLIHGVLWVSAAHELHVGKGLRQADKPVLGNVFLVLLHKASPQLPLVLRLVGRPQSFNVPVCVMGHL